MLIFMAVVTWKQVSLDKALAEERQRNGMYSQVLLPPAMKLGQGNIFRNVCQEFCPRGGGGRVRWGPCIPVWGGRAWQGACMADTMRYGQ